MDRGYLVAGDRAGCRRDWNDDGFRFHVVAYDFGIKRNILRMLAERGCRITVVPAETPAAEVLALQPDGVFLSNGPGDPEPCDYAIEAIRDAARRRHPAVRHLPGPPAARARLRRAHREDEVRPPRRQPPGAGARDRRGHDQQPEPRLRGGRASLPDDVAATHRSLFDGSLQGIRHRERRRFGFQGHPEASPGPHDVAPLFDEFIALDGGAGANRPPDGRR
jgi:carbamoyl-phosphate synthase small subunit